MERPTPEPGQTWADCDKRCSGRQVRVDRVDGMYAYCTVVANADDAKTDTRGRPARLAIQRMTPTTTGWRLVPDPKES